MENLNSKSNIQQEMEETTVVIVGAGPAGLATSACLNRLHIPNIVLERENCYASLWQNRSYDRLKLHLAKEYCHLPYMPFPSDAPTFVPKKGFVKYLDNYVLQFGITPRFNRCVESAFYDMDTGMWRIEVYNTSLNVNEVYVTQFLVVATGENSEGLIPEVPGLDSFGGEYIHSSNYVNGRIFRGKDVLVVGCGNSGMEIAYDLSNWGARTSIVARSPVHVLTKEIVSLGMYLLKFLPCKYVDTLTLKLGKLKHGNISKYGLQRPKKGPFYLKKVTGRSPTIDVGCVSKIKKGEVQVLPSIMKIKGNKIEFENGNINIFDTIIFATGYKSSVGRWLKDSGYLFNENGMPKQSFPNHWKGDCGLYCVGFARNGLLGISNDAKNVAQDLATILDVEASTHPSILCENVFPSEMVICGKHF